MICTCGHRREQHGPWDLPQCLAYNCTCQRFKGTPSSNEITSSNGGKRQRLNARWDKIPGGATSLFWVARVAEYGNIKKNLKGDYENWKLCDPHSEQSPLNHATGHCHEAAELEFGTLDRVWALAKAAWNLLAQIWFEMQVVKEIEGLEGEGKVEQVVGEWFEKKCAPTTFKRTT